MDTPTQPLAISSDADHSADALPILNPHTDFRCKCSMENDESIGLEDLGLEVQDDAN